MKLLRTASSTSRVISSAWFSRSTISRPVALDILAAFEQLLQRLGAGDENTGMPLEQVEELVLAGQKRTKPAEHGENPLAIRCEPA